MAAGSVKPQWLIGVVTAPRIISTLDRTLDSIALAGWPETIAVSHRGESTPSTTWLRCLEILVGIALDHHSTRIVIFEDDVLVSAGLRRHLERSPPPAGLVSLYCSRTNHHEDNGSLWHEIPDVPRRAHGALGYCLDLVLARGILGCQSCQDLGHGATDRMIGYFAKERGVPYWCPSPSLVYHLGEGLSGVEPLAVPRFSRDRNCEVWCEDAGTLTRG